MKRHLPIQTTIRNMQEMLKKAKENLNSQDIHITKNNMDIDAWYDHKDGNFKIHFRLWNDEEKTNKTIVLIVDENDLDETIEGNCLPEHFVQLKPKETKSTYEFL